MLDAEARKTDSDADRSGLGSATDRPEPRDDRGGVLTGLGRWLGLGAGNRGGDELAAPHPNGDNSDGSHSDSNSDTSSDSDDDPIDKTKLSAAQSFERGSALLEKGMKGALAEKRIHDANGFKLIRKASEQGHTEAQMTMATQYINGNEGGARDQAEAESLLEKAAAQTDDLNLAINAMSLRGVVHQQSQPDDQTIDQLDQAVKWMSKAVETAERALKDGTVSATEREWLTRNLPILRYRLYAPQHNLGALYIEAGDPRGVELMIPIAEQTEDLALAVRALRFLSGHAKRQGDTPEKVVEWLLRAIETGLQEMQKEGGYSLGERIDKKGLEEDIEGAKHDLEAVGDVNMTVELVGISDDSLNGEEGARACQTVKL